MVRNYENYSPKVCGQNDCWSRTGDAFQEEVLAYPSITIIEAGKPSAYFDYAEVAQVEELAGMHISKRISPTGEDWTKAFGCY